MEEMQRAEILRDFLNKVPGNNFTTEDMFAGLLFKKLRYGTLYNPSGLGTREGIGNIKYVYQVPENGASITQMIYLRRSGMTSFRSSAHHWDFVDVIVHPIDEENIPYLEDDDILENMFNEERGAAYFKAYKKRVETLSEEEHEVYHETYTVSVCGNYIVCRTEYEYFGPPDPDNNWQQAYQSGSCEPLVYRYNVYDICEKYHHRPCNQQYYRGGENFQVGKASQC